LLAGLAYQDAKKKYHPTALRWFINSSPKPLQP
jgi:hypothetical protein